MQKSYLNLQKNIVVSIELIVLIYFFRTILSYRSYDEFLFNDLYHYLDCSLENLNVEYEDFFRDYPIKPDIEKDIDSFPTNLKYELVYVVLGKFMLHLGVNDLMITSK